MQATTEQTVLRNDIIAFAKSSDNIRKLKGRFRPFANQRRCEGRKPYFSVESSSAGTLGSVLGEQFT